MKPRDADAISDREPRDPVTTSSPPRRRSGDPCECDAGPQLPFHDVQVGPADSACAHRHQKLSLAWPRDSTSVSESGRLSMGADCCR